MALLLAVGALPAVTALAFFVQPRYLVMGVALASVLVGVAVATLTARWRRPVTVGALVLLLLSSVQGFHGPAGWGHPTDQTDHRAAGEWIAANTAPGDRIMTRSFVVEHYAERPTAAVPYADFEQILRFARHYGVQYLVADTTTVRGRRPQLALLELVDRAPGLRLVHEVEVEGFATRTFALDPAPPSDVPMGPSLGFVGDAGG